MKEKKQNILVLLDAHAILHRAFHALPAFTSPNGELTGALYGFAAMLLKIIREFKPDYLAACYDLPVPTFRHIAYEKYKGKRPKMDEGLAIQINRSRDILKVFGIPIYDAPGFEADDVLGTITKQANDPKLKIIVASGDLDTLQLVRGKDVVVYTLKKGIQDAIVYDEEGVKERFGFLPKFLPDFKGLKGDPSDNILGIPGIGDKGAAELIQKFGGLEEIYRFLEKNEKKFLAAGFKPRIVKLLKEHKEEAFFSKELAVIRRDVPIKFRWPDLVWKKKYRFSEAEKLFQELGFKSLRERLPGQKSAGQDNFSLKEISSKQLKKLQVAAWLLDSRRVNKSLEDILEIIGVRSVKEVEKILEEKIKKENLKDFFEKTELPLMDILEEMQKTGVLIDSVVLKKLSLKYEKEITGLKKKIWDLAGQEFNVSSPRQLGVILFDKLKISVKSIKKTGGGGWSTGFLELQKLRPLHPIIDLILKHRELAKLKTTYLDALPKLADKNSRLHTTFNQAGTMTGRFSSQNPNLQNIPVKNERGKEIRRAFIAPAGWVFLAADYSQIELRIAALLSGDKIMTDAFLKGDDIHSATASAIFNVSPDKVTAQMRRQAKVINFGILYGMGVRSLAQNLGVAKEEAQKFYDEYFSDFSGIREYIEKIKEKAKEDGFVETLFGRKRYFPELQNLPPYLHHEFLRMAVNTPIQGTAADFMKIAMVAADQAIKKDSILRDKVKMVLQIHDELLFEVKKEVLPKAAELIKKEMEGVSKNKIPFPADISAGPNWAEMNPVRDCEGSQHKISNGMKK
ncbi:MAG: hypothetical protein HYW71_02695 [Candidatus Niyogibacteria bacterium]|nr:hypothetical protein [Candidatus Niyogibacteria bacterium]